MKIEILTQDDPVYILPFFDEFFRHVGHEFEITQVSCCRTMGGRPRTQLVKELLSLYGASGFAQLLTRMIAAKTLGVLPAKREASRYYSIAQACAAHGTPFRRIANPNAPEFLRSVAARGADLILSIACPYILKAGLLNLPPLGCINIHHAPLPRYKGMMPTFWQLYHGEKSVGLTIHYMVEKIDEGEVLLQESLPVEPGESLDHLIRRSKRHAAQRIVHVLRELATSTHHIVKVDRTQRSYFTFPTLEQIREFHGRGFRSI